MKKINDKISIIIPVYNAERFIKKTIDSVLSQTYENWELLLVDDGSSDNSALICDQYAGGNVRIRVFHKENGGVSSARNMGLENATGKWVCFLDSDDWWNCDFLQNFCSEDMDEYDVILQGFVKEYEGSEKRETIVFCDMVIEGPDNLVKFLERYKGVHNGFIWQRLFKREIIESEEIRFPLNISYAEDGLWFLQYLRNTGKYHFTSKVGHHYNIRQGSLTGQGKKCPKDILIHLLQSYIDAMNSYRVPQDRLLAHQDFIRCYAMRLVENWLLRSAVRNSVEIYSFLDEIKHFVILNKLDKAVSISVLQKILLKVVLQRNSAVKVMLIRILLKLRFHELRIISKMSRGLKI